MFLGKSYFFIIIKRLSPKALVHNLCLTKVTVPAAMVIKKLIEYQIFGQVMNRVPKIAHFGHKWGKCLWKWSAYPHTAFLEYLPG